MDKRIIIGIVGYTSLLTITFIEGFVFGNDNAQSAFLYILTFIIGGGLIILMACVSLYMDFKRGKVTMHYNESGEYYYLDPPDSKGE